MDGEINFLFIVNGPCFERHRSRSAWASFDRAYVKRRDGLARCLAAALWRNTNTVSRGQEEREGGVSLQLPVTCWLLFDEDNILVKLPAHGFTSVCKVWIAVNVSGNNTLLDKCS
jgi:hypothetical protein